MDIDKMFGVSYCINLKERKDRWEVCQKEFEKIGFFPKRFEAIKNEKPWLGCYLSHLEILREARQKRENVLIFEDDVEFVNLDKISISDALDEINDMEWAMGYFGGNILKPFYQETSFWARLNHCQSTHSYFISKEYLNDIIMFLEKNPYIIDVLYANYLVPQFPSYIIIPMVAIQRTSYSNIEQKNMTYDIPIQRYYQNLVNMEVK